ncbi:MAG: hypothetical protein QME32_08450, partial [Endomicrobiia bacterium]|nr:hypothetical protein [Endomicrobiia bacterium]
MKKPRVCYHMMHGAGTVLAAVHKKLSADGSVEPGACAVTFNIYRQMRAARAADFSAMARHPDILDVLVGKGNAAEYPAHLDKYFERAWKNDRLLRYKNRRLAEKVWRASLNRFTKFFETYKPDIVISEIIQSMPCYALFTAATAAGIPYAQISAARLLSGRLELHNDVSGCPYGLDINGAAASPENKDCARKYMEVLNSYGYSGPPYLKYYAGRKIRVGPDDFKKMLGFLAEYIMGGGMEPTREYFFAPFISKIRAMSATRIWSDRGIYAAAEDVRAVEKKKLFFPLHVTPEASTLTWAPEYADMGDTVAAIAARLPEEWVLVAREHPATASIFRSREELKTILSQKNVILV